MTLWNEQVLLLVVALPGAVAVGIALVGLLTSVLGLPALPAAFWRGVGVATAALDFGLALLGPLRRFDPEQLGLQLVARVGWRDLEGLHWLLGLDGIGLCFLLVTTALVPLALLASRAQLRESARTEVALALVLETALLGTIASANLLAFVFFWALSVLPILVWVGRFGGEGRSAAASRIWATESLALAALLFVVFVLRDASVTQLGRPVLDLATAGPIGGPAVPSLLDVFIDPADQTLLFVALGLALALRIPLVPLHFWLPAVHAAAPTPLSIVLATGFVQTAAIGLLRFGLPLLPDAARAAGPSIAVLGIVALVYASLVALVQKELRRLVAWSSIGYAGFAVFGIATLDIQGITGAVVQLVTHGLATSALFMLTGFLATRRKTTEVVAFGGLAKPMPVCAFFFGLMTASLMGLPLLGGFVGDLFVLLGSLGTRRELSLVALVAMVVSASYLLWVQRRVFLGPVDEPANRGLIDLDRVERFVMLAITVPIVAIGLYPNPLLRRIEPAVLEILYEMDRRALPEEGEPQDGPPPAEEGAVGGGVARRSDPPRAEARVAWAIRAPLAGVRR
ncbi:MAG: NADH-quinone oxidoreductase subunit M [Spirochaetaceae bacterium]|nr:NADH-quinone oxidoreductase subunit M [Spirochaetaceae bacterium]